MTDNTIKFCKDCKHSKRDWFWGWQFAKCRVRVISNVDLVSGKKTVMYDEAYCENQRKYSCGINAKLFEPKEKRCSLWN